MRKARKRKVKTRVKSAQKKARMTTEKRSKTPIEPNVSITYITNIDWYSFSFILLGNQLVPNSPNGVRTDKAGLTTDSETNANAWTKVKRRRKVERWAMLILNLKSGLQTIKPLSWACWPEPVALIAQRSTQLTCSFNSFRIVLIPSPWMPRKFPFANLHGLKGHLGTLLWATFVCRSRLVVASH